MREDDGRGESVLLESVERLVGDHMLIDVGVGPGGQPEEEQGEGKDQEPADEAAPVPPARRDGR